MESNLDQVIRQVGTRYLPKGMKIHRCGIHGGYMLHYTNQTPKCPVCGVPPTPQIPIKEEDSGTGNGTTSKDVDLYVQLNNQAKMFPW